MTDNAKREAVKETIANLLRQTEANGATEAVAEEAMKAARRLMRKHGLTAEDVMKRSDACVDFAETTARAGFVHLNLVDKVLNNTIAKFTDTQVYRLIKIDGKYEIRFFGYRVDTELAEFLYKVCCLALTTEWNKYKVKLAKEDRGPKVRTNFQMGVALRLRERLLELIGKDETTGTDLIVLKNQLVVAALNAAKGQMQESNMVALYDTSRAAFHDGFDAGANVRLNREVGPVKAAKQLGGSCSR